MSEFYTVVSEFMMIDCVSLADRVWKLYNKSDKETFYRMIATGYDSLEWLGIGTLTKMNSGFQDGNLC